MPADPPPIDPSFADSGSAELRAGDPRADDPGTDDPGADEHRADEHRAGDPMDAGLTCSDEVPLTWEAIQAPPSGTRLAAVNAANEALLRACGGLEEPHRGYEEVSELAQELQRLESKLDLALALLAERLRRPEDVPPLCPVRFNAHGMAWDSPAVPPVGALVRLEAYICPSFPKPLVLFGTVLRQESVAATAEAATTGNAPVSRAVARFVGISLSLADALERLVFLRHRRQVAEMRGQRRDEDA